mmetsp:Transcript_71476/g.209905  ORF Transcript_71476/g.209905 Transcript_71476/m.209905 type:complete len:209 (+) Transcript_71476:156-782(+)
MGPRSGVAGRPSWKGVGGGTMGVGAGMGGNSAGCEAFGVASTELSATSSTSWSAKGAVDGFHVESRRSMLGICSNFCLSITAFNASASSSRLFCCRASGARWAESIPTSSSAVMSPESILVRNGMFPGSARLERSIRACALYSGVFPLYLPNSAASTSAAVVVGGSTPGDCMLAKAGEAGLLPVRPMRPCLMISTTFKRKAFCSGLAS